MAVLYMNESVAPAKLWDPETGEDYGSTAREEQEIEELISQGKQLESLQQAPGWQIVTDFLKLMVSDYMHKLTLETDHKKIRRLQEAIKAYSNVLSFVNYKINEAKAFDKRRTPPSEGQSTGE